MRIAVTIEHFAARTGGAEAFAVTVLRTLRDRGHEIFVYAVDGEALEGITLECGPLREAPGRIEARGVDLSLDWGLNCPARLHRLGGGTHREFQRLVLQAFPWFKRWPKRLLYAVLPRHRRIARTERRLLEQPDTHVLAVSRFVAAQVERAACLPSERIHVLHNGVDLQRFGRRSRAGDRADVRAEFGLDDTHTVFLMVAHNLGMKNFSLPVRVFRRLHAELPTIRLMLLGRRRPSLEAPWFVYAGSSPRPERLYAAADVLLHPTYYDACANVVLEAMASGLAVVSSDRNGSAELLETESDGIVLPVVGPRVQVDDAWEQAIARLARQPDFRAALATAAETSARRFDIEHYVDRFEALLVDIAACPR